jgi:hypothetical protein
MPMKWITYLALAAGLALVQSCSTHDEVLTSTPTYVSFYEVQLVCPAAPQIGCGSAAKPILRELEQQPGVKKALLNRGGTVMALVWQPATSVRQRVNATARATAYGKALSGAAEARARADFLSRTNDWFRAAEVDRLSEEEAEIIAARLVRRTQTKTALPKESAAALQRLIADAARRRFIDPASNPQEDIEARVQARAKELLNERQFAAFEEACAAGYRPLANEQ